MKMEEIMEKALMDADIDDERFLEISYETFNAFAELNELDESKMFEFSDTGGIPIFCFDGTEDELINMETPEGCTIVVEGLNIGSVRYVMVYDIRIFGWPAEITSFYIELKSELEEAGML